jgi:hypothetical protein
MNSGLHANFGVQTDTTSATFPSKVNTTSFYMALELFHSYLYNEAFHKICIIGGRMNSGLHANFVESLVIKIRVEEFQCHIKGCGNEAFHKICM